MSSPAKRPPSPLRTWLQLLRAPNLFTVPGDPLVGFLLASAGFIGLGLGQAVAASLCFYGAGLLANDLADLDEDRRDRPARPLPSGAAARRHVIWAAFLLAAVGLGLLVPGHHHQALLCGGALIVAIGLYNFVTKGWPVLGALNMGLCRGLSVMLGACMGPDYGHRLGVPAAVIIGLYIAAVTNLARHETRARVPVPARLLPALVLLLAALGGSGQAIASPEKSYAIPLFVLLAVLAIWQAARLFRHPAPPLPPLIGVHIRFLLPLQAALVWLADPWGFGRVAALVLLGLWPVARVVSRWFYAS